MSACRVALALTVIALIVVTFLWWQQVKLGVILQKPPLDWFPSGSAASLSEQHEQHRIFTASHRERTRRATRGRRQERHAWSPSRGFVRAVTAQSLLFLQTVSSAGSRRTTTSTSESNGPVYLIRCPVHDMLRQWGSHQPMTLAVKSTHLVAALDVLHQQMGQVGNRGRTLLRPGALDPDGPWLFHWIEPAAKESPSAFQRVLQRTLNPATAAASSATEATLTELWLSVPSFSGDGQGTLPLETARVFVEVPAHDQSLDWTISDKRTGLLWFVGALIAT